MGPVNSQKVDLVAFTHKYKMSSIEGSVLRGIKLAGKFGEISGSNLREEPNLERAPEKTVQEGLCALLGVQKDVRPDLEFEAENSFLPLHCSSSF